MSHNKEWYSQALQFARDQRSEVPSDILSVLEDNDSDRNFGKMQAKSVTTDGDFLQVGLVLTHRSDMTSIPWITEISWQTSLQNSR